MNVTIREKSSGTVLAEAESGAPELLTFEGNLYFDPTAVRSEVLKVTERTYTCPYKGTCHWVDYVAADGSAVKDVAWVYAQPKAGHEAIKDRYGFYAQTRGGTTREG